MRQGMSLFDESLRGPVKREGKLRRRKILPFFSQFEEGMPSCYLDVPALVRCLRVV